MNKTISLWLIIQRMTLDGSGCQSEFGMIKVSLDLVMFLIKQV